MIVPIFNESENIKKFLSKILEVQSSNEFFVQIIFIVDPCTDDTIETIKSEMLQYKDKLEILAIITNKRYGQAYCIKKGFQYSTSDCVVVIDVDLQDPIELVPRMVSEWRLGNKVILARRNNKEKSLYFVLTQIFYLLLIVFGRVTIPRNVGDFRLLDKSIVDCLKLNNYYFPFLRGETAELNVKSKVIDFDRKPRFHGETKYQGFNSRFKVALNALIDFTYFFEFIIIILVFTAIKFIFEQQMYLLSIKSQVIIITLTFFSLMILKINRKLYNLKLNNNVIVDRIIKLL